MKRFLYIIMFVLTASVTSYAQALATNTSLSTKKFSPPSDFVYVMDSTRVLKKIPLIDAPTLLSAIKRAGGGPANGKKHYSQFVQAHTHRK